MVEQTIDYSLSDNSINHITSSWNISIRGVTIHFNSDTIRITIQYKVDDTIHVRYWFIHWWYDMIRFNDLKSRIRTGTFPGLPVHSRAVGGRWDVRRKYWQYRSISQQSSSPGAATAAQAAHSEQDGLNERHLIGCQCHEKKYLTTHLELTQSLLVSGLCVAAPPPF